MLNLAESEWKVFIDFVYKETGIFIESNKTRNVLNRINLAIEGYAFKTGQDFLRKMVVDIKLKQIVIDAVTVNETLFFRDKLPFEYIKQNFIPKHFEGGAKNLNILSAASSTGQEAYSIAITLKELLGDLTDYNLKVQGIDISDKAIRQANLGEYTSFELNRGLNPNQVEKYFHRVKNNFRINDDIKFIAQFKKQSLFNPLVSGKSFDLILCRNVGIYFQLEDKIKLFENMANYLKLGGVLIIGATESLPDLNVSFEKKIFRGAVYYEKVGL